MGINNKKQLMTNEFLNSPFPQVTSSLASAIKTHNFDKVTSFITVKNTGVSGSLSVAFTSTGFASNNYFPVSAGETLSLPFSLKSLFVSGAAQQPYSIIVGVTQVTSSFIEDVSLANGFTNI